jgi:hypothetical protein
MNSKTKKLSTSAVVWGWICLAANIAAGTLSVVYNMDKNDEIAIIGLFIGFLCAGGYALLLAGKKAGFFIICGTAILGAIFSIIARMYPQAVFCFLNPLITWFFIKGNWKSWHEIDVRKKTEKETYQQQYNEHFNINSFFWKRGKKFKTWSIVNTCMFLPFVLPILAIIESNKAQKAQDKETHDRHIKKALIFNLCTYAMLIPFSVLMNYLESIGVVVTR